MWTLPRTGLVANLATTHLHAATPCQPTLALYQCNPVIETSDEEQIKGISTRVDLEHRLVEIFKMFGIREIN